MSEHETTTKGRLTSAMTGSHRSLPRMTRLTGYIIGAVLVLVLAFIGFRLAILIKGNPDATVKNPPQQVEESSNVPLTLQRPVVDEAGLMEKSGVRIVYVAVTADGGLIDLRYQVIDPDKAATVHDEDTYPPTIIDESTGLVVDNLLMGHLHTREFNAGQTYYLIFENPGNLVRQGSTVSVLLGDAELDQVIVK
jgi:predicted phosphodiesterase